MANKIVIDRLLYLIDHYMETRREPTIISTAKVARALSTLMTACPLVGRSLEDAIAEAAVRYGHVVQFDFTDTQQQHAMPQRVMEAA
jgi:hypothetical protein